MEDCAGVDCVLGDQPCEVVPVFAGRPGPEPDVQGVEHDAS